MIPFVDVTNAFVDTLRRIPELVALLDSQNPESIFGYIDLNPTANSVADAEYTQPPGTVMVVWQEITLQEGGTMEPWLHRVHFFLRALDNPPASEMVMASVLARGIPDPGDGLRWYYCPVMDGLLPTSIRRIGRIADPEQIDLWVVETETKETGDV